MADSETEIRRVTRQVQKTHSTIILRVQDFLDRIPGESGLTPKGVDRLCAILNGTELNNVPDRHHIMETREIKMHGRTWEYIES